MAPWASPSMSDDEDDLAAMGFAPTSSSKDSESSKPAAAPPEAANIIAHPTLVRQLSAASRVQRTLQRARLHQSHAGARKTSRLSLRRWLSKNVKKLEERSAAEQAMSMSSPERPSQVSFADVSAI